jgi:hypothetical protein
MLVFSMTNDLSQNQAKMVAEKTAIIANTAFMLGREAEAKRVIDIIKTELDNYPDNSAGGHAMERIIDLLSSKGQTNGETN